MNPQVKYGLIAAATGIVLSLLTYVLGLDRSDAGQYIPWINVPVTIACMVYAIKERRDKQLGGYIEFGKAFGTATLTVVIASAVTSIFTYIYFSFINPSIREFLVQKQADKMEAKGMSQEQIDMAMQYTEKFMTPVMMTIVSFLSGVILGMIVSLIIAAIMKKPNPDPFATPVQPINPGTP